MATDGTADAADDEESELVGVAMGAVTFVTLAAAFGLMFAGVEQFWIAFPVGFGGGMPLAAALASWYESERAAGRERGGERRERTGRSDADDALDRLRERYARGEIDDAEFEARVERLLETESVDDAETFLGGASDGTGIDGPAERGSDGQGEGEVERA